MSAAIMEKEPRETRKTNKSRDRITILLKPHVRMRLHRISKEEGLSYQLMTRQLVMEALAARGFTNNAMLADWHLEISEAVREGKKHPFGLDAR
jgi:hypothetical protein